MQILIFANKTNKIQLQQILNWGLDNKGFKFQMFFTVDKDKVKSLLKFMKYDLIVSCNKQNSLFLKKNNIKFKNMYNMEFSKYV